MFILLLEDQNFLSLYETFQRYFLMERDDVLNAVLIFLMYYSILHTSPVNTSGVCITCLLIWTTIIPLLDRMKDGASYCSC